MPRAGFDGNVGWGANLPVCRIFRRGIDVYSSFSPRSGEAEFVQPSNLCHVFCMHISGSHSQIYHCTKQSLTKTSVAGGSVLTGGVFHLLVSNPNLVLGAQHLSTAVPGGKP